MSIPRWNPSTTTTKQETYLLSRLKRTRKLYSFLRLHRLDLFDEGFQAELETMYRSTGAGKPPCPPALMAMACLLQGYQQVSDAEAVEMTVVDRRWQLVLDRLGEDEPAFAQGTLVDFRDRLIRTDMDRRLLERTAALAKKTQGFDPKKLPKTLRVAIDSAPLQGAGRVEDTINLLWHGAKKIVEGMALMLKLDKETVCQQAGITLLLASSAKAALDRDWSQPGATQEALDQLIDQLESLVTWLSFNHGEQMALPPVAPYVQVLQQVIGQDLEPDPDPAKEELRLREGVAKDRRISVEEPQMRHGRKSKSQRIDGYKRHMAKDLDTGLVLACALTPANRPEAEAVPSLEADLAAQKLTVDELHVDQAYVNSTLAQDVRARGGQVLCRPRVTNNGKLFRKEDFPLDLEKMTVSCPAGHQKPIQLGKTVVFEASLCRDCLLRPRCTEASPQRGRTLSVAADEPIQQQLRERIKTPQGRAALRERVDVEHGLAHLVYRQGDQARYFTQRKNLYDTRRAGAIQNLETIQRVNPQLPVRTVA
jgi:hypothetical protein